MNARRTSNVALMLAALAVAGCGQKGALYLPEVTGEIVTRPTQTPADSSPPDTGASGPEDDTPPRARPSPFQ